MKRFIWALCLCACQPAARDTQGASSQTRSRAQGAVVATVGNEEIGLEDVKQLVQATGLTPEQALDRLVAEDLLQGLADEKGYADSRLLLRETKKAQARALLEVEVERAVRDDMLNPAAVQARFAELKPTLDRPEQRELVRLLWPKRDGADVDALRARAEQALARLKLVEPDSYRVEMSAIQREAAAAGDNVRISGVHARAGQSDAIVKAAWTLTAPGLIPEVVEGPNGFAVALLEAILPASEAKFAEHEASIREQLVTEGRRARSEALIRDLRARAEVTYNEDAITRAFADDSLGNPR